MIYKCGHIYQGKWKNNRKHGKGKMILKDGTIKDGLWYKDNFFEESPFKYSNGDLFVGRHAFGYKDGHGVM